MKEGQLTLVIPNLNGSRYLAQTLESICAQGGDARWWLQDGGSDDSSVEIAKAFKREDDTIVVQCDDGQADAINRGVQKMGGQIIGYLNSDDCLTPGAAGKVLQAFAQNLDADIVYGGIEFIGPDSVPRSRHRGAIFDFHQVMDIYHYWWKGKQLVQPEVFFRRRLFERLGGFDNRYRLAFDFDFWVRAFASGAKAVRLPDIVAKFRIHPEQKSTDRQGAADEIRDSVERHLHLLPLYRKTFLGARLSFDRYQRMAESPLPHALLSHPEWLLTPEAWRRIGLSIAERWKWRK